MRKVLLGLVFITILSLVVATGTFAGELEDQLFKAIDNVDVEGVRSLISRGADVNAKDEYGSVYDFALEVFYGACMGGDSAICQDSENILNMLEAAGAKGDQSQ